MNFMNFYTLLLAAMSKPSTPNFRGNSYLILPPPRIPVKDKRKGPSLYIRPRESLQISMNFSTIEPDGLLLWSEKDKTKFLGLGIEHGHIKLASNLLENSNSTIGIPSGGYVSDGAWHNVQIITDRGKIELLLDGDVIFSEKANTNPSLLRRGKDLSITYEDLFLIGKYAKKKKLRTYRNLFKKYP